MSGRRLAALAAISTILIVTALFLARMDDRPGGGPARQYEVTPSLADRTTTPNPSREQGAAERVQAQTQALQPDRRQARICGVVLDRQFRVPVVARLTPAVGSSVVTRMSDGRFDLHAEDAHELTVSASGYRTEVIRELAAGDEQVEILLDAEPSGAVMVESPIHSPAPGVTVEWRSASDEPANRQVHDWVLARAQTAGEVHTSLTGPDGIARVTLGSRALAIVRDDSRGAKASVYVEPGQTVRVVLPDRLLRVRFVDADSFAPILGIEVDVWSPRSSDAAALPLTSDADGIVRFPVISYPVQIRRSGAAIWQQELTPISPGLSMVGFGGTLRPIVCIANDVGDGEYLVGVREVGGRVRLIDSESGERIDAELCIDLVAADCGQMSELECASYSPRWGGRNADRVFTAIAGEVVLPHWSPRVDTMPREAQAKYRAVFSVAGYRPESMAFLALPGRGETAELRLSRVPQKWVRVTQADGTPFQESVGVYSREWKQLLWQRAGALDGLHGPFDWPGGDVAVRIAGENSWERSVVAQALHAADIVSVDVDGTCGSIRVVGVPPAVDGIRLVAYGGRGSPGMWRAATQFAPGEVRFSGLGIGQYIVGPDAWVRAMQLQTVAVSGFVPGKENDHRGRVLVRAGEEAILQWEPSWSAEARIEGRVRLIGDGVEQPFLIPLYSMDRASTDAVAQAVPRLVCGRRSPRIPLDYDGRYRIEAGQPVPALLAICQPLDSSWGSVVGFQVIESIVPGDDAEIPTARVRLKWAGEPTNASVQVRYTIDPLTLREPVSTYFGTRSESWTPTQDFLLDSVPLSVRSIFVQSRSYAVELKAGDVAEVMVE